MLAYENHWWLCEVDIYDTTKTRTVSISFYSLVIQLFTNQCSSYLVWYGNETVGPMLWIGLHESNPRKYNCLWVIEFLVRKYIVVFNTNFQVIFIYIFAYINSLIRTLYFHTFHLLLNKFMTQSENPNLNTMNFQVIKSLLLSKNCILMLFRNIISTFKFVQFDQF